MKPSERIGGIALEITGEHWHDLNERQKISIVIKYLDEQHEATQKTETKNE